MRIDELQPAPGARQKEKRLGRGIGSGVGKTSGKGHKGQNARSGGGVRPGFDGNPISFLRRVPKFGFTNNFRKIYSTVNVGDLEKLENDSAVNETVLLDKKIIGKTAPYGLKILGNGNLTKKLNVVCSKITASAREKIEKAGGKVEVK